MNSNRSNFSTIVPTYFADFSAEAPLKPLPIVGICVGALAGVVALCMLTVIGYKCWKKKRNQAQSSGVHRMTNVVELDCHSPHAGTGQHSVGWRQWNWTRWGQTTPQMGHEMSGFLLIFNNFVTFHHFFTKLGNLIWVFVPNNLTWMVMPNVKLWRHNWWRHIILENKILEFVNFSSVLERTRQEELNAENSLSMWQIMDEIWHFRFWKFHSLKMGSPLV